MKANIFIGCCFLACVFSACNSCQQKAGTGGNKTEKQAQINGVFLKDTSAVKAALDTIYTTICNTYNGGVDEALQSKSSFDRRFCTTAWNETMEACEKVRMKKHDQLGCFDYDYWINAQDWDVVSYKVEGITMQNSEQAIGFLKFKNGQTTTTFMLTMRKEGGRWLIDDLMSDGEGNESVMQCAREYLKK